MMARHQLDVKELTRHNTREGSGFRSWIPMPTSDVCVPARLSLRARELTDRLKSALALAGPITSSTTDTQATNAESQMNHESTRPDNRLHGRRRKWPKSTFSTPGCCPHRPLTASANSGHRTGTVALPTMTAAPTPVQIPTQTPTTIAIIRPSNKPARRE